MNKRILFCDFGLFILEELVLLVLRFIIPAEKQSILLTCVILIFLFVCSVTSSIYLFRYIKRDRVTLNDVAVAFALVVTATLIYLGFYNNTFPLFTGLQGTVFLGITMTIGIHGLSYMSRYLLDRSKEFGFGQKAKEYLFFSSLFDKTKIITIIGTIIVVIIKTITEF